MRLSILDQSPVPEGGTAAEALRASVELARAAERLGTTRYWVAEHHGSPGFAGTAPEIMTGAILAATERMRVGSGGVLLPRYPASKVAEVFGVLESLHPGRVDLGVGRAGGPADDYPAQIAELIAHLGEHPPVWVLGASVGSATLAARLGTSYCFAHFLNPPPGTAALAEYRAHRSEPRSAAAVAVRVLLADTAAAAADLAQAFLLWRSRKDLGHDGQFPSRETVRRHDWTADELARARANSRALVFGTPEQVRSTLTELAVAHGVEELVINTLTHDPADRLRSYDLLHQAMADLAEVG